MIQSDIELPELPLAPQSTRAEWRICTAPRSFVGHLGMAIGAEAVYDGIQVRSFGAGDVRRLVYDDTGTFEIRPRDRLIVWFPGAGATDAAVRADILGRVIGVAAHADGHMMLHASAVSIHGEAIAFLGPKHAGKSTLAVALVREGARLITDDTLIVRVATTGKAIVSPGVQQVRLWEDSARALAMETSQGSGAKPTVGRLTTTELAVEDVPLAACYVLQMAEPETVVPVRRRRLTPPQAAIACVRFSKLGALAGGVDAGGVLDRASVLTRIVPVLTATVRRDLTTLEQVGSSFLAWHAGRDPAPS